MDRWYKKRHPSEQARLKSPDKDVSRNVIESRLTTNRNVQMCEIPFHFDTNCVFALNFPESFFSCLIADWPVSMSECLSSKTDIAV